jgi:5-methylcytosine-specific restriction endonuclease McrA
VVAREGVRTPEALPGGGGGRGGRQRYSAEPGGEGRRGRTFREGRNAQKCCGKRERPLRRGACLHCGAAWESVDKRQRFCSGRCAMAYRWLSRHPKREIVCACGTALTTGRPWARFCSKRCRAAAGRARHRRPRKPLKTTACPRCGKHFRPWADGAQHARKFCSRACAYPPRRERAPRPVRACLWCLVPFEARSKRQRCCSKACRSRVESRQRKVRLRGLGDALITPASVYRRDGGRCGLCRRKVSARLRYPHPGAATVDHIVPITAGGRHVLENVQLAHARCNIAKGNRPCGSQLRLIG